MPGGGTYFPHDRKFAKGGGIWSLLSLAWTEQTKLSVTASQQYILLFVFSLVRLVTGESLPVAETNYLVTGGVTVMTLSVTAGLHCNGFLGILS